MTILTSLRIRATSVYRWLADSAHRRAVAYVVALIAGHFLGKQFDVENIDTILAVLLGAGAAAWTPSQEVSRD